MTTVPQDRMAPLTEAYITAWQRIKAEQEVIANDPNRIRRLRRLRELEASVTAILNELDDYSRAFIQAEMPNVYSLGARRAALVLNMQPSFAQVDTETIRTLSGDLFDDLLAKTGYVRQETKAAIRRALKDQIIQGQIVGNSPAQTRKLVRDRMEEIGIRGVRYSNGRFVGLDDYAEMAIRTKTATAQNLAGLNFGKRQGVEWYECLDGPGCGLSGHGVGGEANGQVRPAEVAMQYPIAHPRCRRIWSPRPDVSSEREAARAKPSITPEQLADQLAADEARRAARRRGMAAKRRHDARLSARRRRISA